MCRMHRVTRPVDEDSIFGLMMKRHVDACHRRGCGSVPYQLIPG